MSNLAHHDVEQGRFAQADEHPRRRAAVQRGARHPDLQHVAARRCRPGCGCCRAAGGRPSRTRSPCSAAGDIPLGRLWSHLVLGLLAARRDAPAENPHLDELWRLATKLDVPGVLAPAAAALAEQAWITRRPDPRLDEPLVTALADLPGHGRRPAAPVGATARRAGVQHVGAPAPHRHPCRAARAAALRAGAGAVGRRVGRRAAGRAPAAGRAGRPGGRRAGPRPAARARGDQPAPRPVARHPGQPGRAHRAAARRAGPARPRA